MKHIFLNLKRFDVPVEYGGVNRLAAPADWGKAIVEGTQAGLAHYDPAEVEFVMYLPEAHIPAAVAARAPGSPVQVGCQGVYRDDTAPGGNFGAFTTNRPAAAAKALGCDSVLIGHCEERADKLGILAEAGVTGQEASRIVSGILNKEIKAAVARGLTVLYCIGEKSEEQDAWQQVLGDQLSIGLEGVDKSKVTIAYEPIWSIAFAAWFEKLYSKYIPDTIKLFAIPLITCTVTFCLTLWVIGPIAAGAGDLLGVFFNWLANVNGILLGAVVGGLWQILVMFGLHWAIVPMMLNNLATQGFDTAMVGMFGTTFAQVGAVAAIWIKTKNKKTKSLCAPAFISAIAGVTEPAIYGITLPKKTPFYITCVVAAVIGGLLMAFGVTSYTSAGMGVFGYTAYINTITNDISGMITSIVLSLVSVAAAFVLTFLTYHDEPAKKN